MLTIVTAHLVFLPWALGTMRIWAQLISAFLAVAGIVLALLPRNHPPDASGSAGVRFQAWAKLIAFPIFWIGLALLVYVTVQALNPAWTYWTDGPRWRMVASPHLAWLPAGVSVPFEKGGPSRMLLIYASAWLTICTIWIGFSRRRALRLLFVALALNGALLAVFGIVQQRLGNGKIFWSVDSPSLHSFASFIYKNHAGAYLGLALAVTCGLAAWHYQRGLRHLEKSHPGVVFAFLALGIAGSIFLSYARGATFMTLVFLLGCAAAFAVHHFRLPPTNRRPAIAVALVLVFGIFVATGFFSLRSHSAQNSRDVLLHLKHGVTQQDDALATRQLATAAALEMLGDHGVRGVGAGSFRFLFTIYQARHPALLSQNGDVRYWEHAHNDLVQIPIELGLVGTGLLLLAGGCWAVMLVRGRFWCSPIGASCVAGLLLLVAGAWWDFPFQCPAILITACAIATVTAMWLRFEEKR